MRNDLVLLLHEGQYTLVVSNGETRTFDRRGVADLFHLMQDDPGFLRGASLADKVVGKAAAALMVLGKIKEVHADVISEPGLALLQQTHIPVSYGEVVPHIINRTKTGWCPLERLCHDCQTPQECYRQIEGFIQNLEKDGPAS